MSPGKQIRWLTIVSYDDQDRTITVAISDARYEYWMKDGCYEIARTELDKRKRSQSQQLQWIKAHSSKFEKVNRPAKAPNNPNDLRGYWGNDD